MALKLYHGTQYERADLILQGGFRYSRNKEAANWFWLGHGIYFFLDKRIAEYWANRKKVVDPCIITAEADIDDKILDLRSVDGANTFVGLYKDYLKATDTHIIKEEIDGKVFQCSLFDYILINRGYNGVIAHFNLERQQQGYLDETFHDLRTLLNGLSFPETQVCIREDVQHKLLKNIKIEL